MEQRISRLGAIRYGVIGLTVREYDVDLRTRALRIMYYKFSTLIASREEHGEASAPFDAAFIKAEFKSFIESLPCTPLLATNSYILRTMNSHLRSLQSADELE